MTKISQSLIKDMTGEYCEYYLKLKYIDGIQTEPTTAMMAGLAFESKLLGSARGGVFEYPKLKNGGISAAEKDIDEVVQFARDIFDENKIEVLDVQVFQENDNALGTIDAIIKLNGKLMIMDVKFTGLTYDQFERELTYSQLLTNYALQSRQYQSLHQVKLPFLFAVFSKHGWCRMFGFHYNEEEIIDHKHLIKAKELEFNSLTFKPATDANMCFKCNLKDICTKRSNRINIEVIENY